MGYLPMQNLMLGRYNIEIYPYINIPANMYNIQEGDAIQFGADFTISFSREGEHASALKMLQFIYPQEGTANVSGQTAGVWNLDRAGDKFSDIDACVYGEPSFELHIGPNNLKVQKSEYSPKACKIADTPRDIYPVDERQMPLYLETKFANFAFESNKSWPRTIFQGITWSIGFKQRGTGDRERVFDLVITPPSIVTDISLFASALFHKGVPNKSYRYCG